MKLFVGLGNPGEKYEKTRHNLGFLMLEQLADAEGFTDFLYQKKYDAELATGMIGKWQVIALKPLSYMNKSGTAVRDVCTFYKISPEDVLIFHDEIDIDFGAMKLKFNGGHGGHNGVRDIYAKSGQTGYRRLKLGVGRPPNPKFDVADFLLSNFTSNELLYWTKQEKQIRDRVDAYLRNTGGSK